MEEATGAPSSLAVSVPKRLRASGRDGDTVMTEPPSPLRMLLSRHTRRREVITLHATIESEQRDSRINVAHSRVNPAMLCSKSRQSWAELYAFE
jgi:hypothetical protein